MNIEFRKEPFDVDVKRFYVPLTFTDKCPKCGVLDKVSYTNDQYLSYPTVNEPFLHTQYFYCNECDHEWESDCELTLVMDTKNNNDTETDDDPTFVDDVCEFMDFMELWDHFESWRDNRE